MGSFTREVNSKGILDSHPLNLASFATHFNLVCIAGPAFCSTEPLIDSQSTEGFVRQRADHNDHIKSQLAVLPPLPRVVPLRTYHPTRRFEPRAVFKGQSRQGRYRRSKGQVSYHGFEHNGGVTETWGLPPFECGLAYMQSASLIFWCHHFCSSDPRFTELSGSLWQAPADCGSRRTLYGLLRTFG